MKNLLPLLCFVLLSSGCAIIFTGTTDTITFDSDPQGASVYKDGIELCVTPCVARLERSIADVQVEFQLDGYKARIVTLDTKFNLVSIINTINLVGWVVDILTGSVKQYDRKQYNITLKEDKSISMLHRMYPYKIDINTKDKIVDFYVEQSRVK